MHNLSETGFYYLPYHPSKVIKIIPKKLLSFPGLQNILSMIHMRHAIPLFNFFFFFFKFPFKFRDLILIFPPYLSVSVLLGGSQTRLMVSSSQKPTISCKQKTLQALKQNKTVNMETKNVGTMVP